MLSSSKNVLLLRESECEKNMKKERGREREKEKRVSELNSFNYIVITITSLAPLFNLTQRVPRYDVANQRAITRVNCNAMIANELLRRVADNHRDCSADNKPGGRGGEFPGCLWRCGIACPACAAAHAGGRRHHRRRRRRRHRRCPRRACIPPPVERPRRHSTVKFARY